MTDQRPGVKAATFRLWYELLEETVAHDPDDIAPGNQWSAVILLQELIGVGVRSGAIRPIVIHSSGPSSYAHLMFRYALEPEFDWSGEIQLVPDRGDAATHPDLLVAGLSGRIGQHLDAPPTLDRIADQLLALGYEQSGFVALLLAVQRANILDQRIGQAGDLDEATGARRVAQGAVQRQKSEVASSPPSWSRSASSPASTPGPSTSSHSRCMERKEARMA